MGRTQIIDQHLFSELFSSLASLLRSYTALHGLPRSQQATLEHDHTTIRVFHGEKSLVLTRHHEIITWARENGNKGTAELTEAGNLRASDSEQPMDLAAEHWVRELMQ